MLYPLISYSTEVIDIRFSRDLTLCKSKPDEDEFLDVSTATSTELLNGAMTAGLLMRKRSRVSFGCRTLYRVHGHWIGNLLWLERLTIIKA